MFTFGLGYRMCSGHLLAAREVYHIFMRLFASFRIEPCGETVVDPAVECKNPRDLIMGPKAYKVLFVPRDEGRLRATLEEGEGEVV